MRPVADNALLIAFVSNNAWSVYNFRLAIIRCLIESGHRVVVVSPADEYAQRLTNEGCAFFPVQFNNRSLNPISDLMLYRSLRQVYSTLKPDLIFHFVAKPNIYGSMAAGSLGIPSVAVITGLGFAFDRKDLLRTIVEKLYRRALKNVAETWFLNREDAQVFLNGALVSAQNVKILPGEGVDTEYFHRPGKSAGAGSPAFTFLMSCRLLRSKGVAVYAEASRILKNRNHQFNCILIGFHEAGHPDAVDAADLTDWEKQGLISFPGFTEDVRSFLESADCFVLPSYYNEGIPRSLLEAASMELPVITTYNRGCKEAVRDNITGFLCNTRDAADLADKMEQMLLLPPLTRREMGKKGRELMIEKFEVRKVYRYYANVIQRFG
jgi:glycosyltransferase involved in cell wall biosynthesis